MPDNTIDDQLPEDTCDGITVWAGDINITPDTESLGPTTLTVLPSTGVVEIVFDVDLGKVASRATIQIPTPILTGLLLDQLRRRVAALSRDLVAHGDMTPMGARVLDQVLTDQEGKR